MTFPSLWKSSPSSFTPHLSHSIFPSQSSHLLYQRLCTHTFLLPSSPLALPHCYLFFSPTPVPLFVVVFFHTLLLSHLCTLFFPSPWCLCLFSFVSSPRWTGRWTSSSPTAAWTSTTVCFRSCCSSNTWCGASARSGSTSREQVRGWKLLIRAQLGLHLTAKKEELRFFLLCFSVYKIFIERNAAIPLCFIYTKHISCQWDCCKTVCFSGLDSIDQWKHVCRLHKWISWKKQSIKLLVGCKLWQLKH